jgi:hypothetical protein
MSRVLDCLRTWPLIVYATGVVGGWPVSAPVVIVLVVYTAILNIAMYRNDANKTIAFTTPAKVLYALSYVSPISFIIDRPGRGAIKKSIVVVGNIACCTYTAYQLVVAVTIADAWACYPRNTRFSDLDRGYCPQKNGDFYNSLICRNQYFSGTDEILNPRCGQDWQQHAHKILPAHVHVIINFLAVTATIYAYQVHRSINRITQSVCIN